MGRNVSAKTKIISSKWRREHYQEATRRVKNRKIKKIVEKAEKNPLNSMDLNICLSKIPNFLGIFASDQVPLIHFVERPVFFIVNIDSVSEKGSHWIALRLGKSKLEIFDSLGFHTALWSNYPEKFINWLKVLSLTHKIFVSQLTQEQNTFICGLYCIFFIIYRQFSTFSQCCSQFSLDYALNTRRLEMLLLNF